MGQPTSEVALTRYWAFALVVTGRFGDDCVQRQRGSESQLQSSNLPGSYPTLRGFSVQKSLVFSLTRNTDYTVMVKYSFAACAGPIKSKQISSMVVDQNHLLCFIPGRSLSETFVSSPRTSARQANIEINADATIWIGGPIIFPLWSP